MNKKHFFLKLIPPRTTFMMDMTEEEKAIMQQHVVYWGKLLNDGIAIVYGPVMDPKGGYGAGVVAVNSDEHLSQIIADDPANGMNKYEFYPMQAVYKQN